MRVLGPPLIALLLLGLTGCQAFRSPEGWPAWERFARHFISDDGRVIDHTDGARTVSEGQAYAAFFALVANDRERFEQILTWTANNLAAGDLSQRLPAWLWGLRDDGSWGVKDANPASDADLWLAYALLEAGRLWQEPRYHHLGSAILQLVRQQAVAELPGLGPMLLPAPEGFRLEGDRVRLNPSYLPEFQFRYFAAVDPQGPWALIWRHHLHLMRQVLIRGLAPDWFEVNGEGRPLPDSVKAPVLSYDAIRVYLWAGMSIVEGQPSELLNLLAPAAPLLLGGAEGFPHDRIDPVSGEGSGPQPPGFSAALLPYLAALKQHKAQARQQARLKALRTERGIGEPAHYYDQVLALFGEGYVDRQFRFAADGRLMTRWTR